MKNILNIMKHDLRKITGSVVAIITVMGLCIVPCLYAWFNIFSNWSPYESDATGRIAVAVVSCDKGVTAAGLTINVGDKITEALEANRAIGWHILSDEEEAIEGVYAGDYYAALIIPENFSADVMSFANGDLTNPTIKYYENEKKNAIAPKITGKAKTALQEQIDSMFVETLASYVSDASSVARSTGTDPAEMLSDLSVKIEDLSGDINSCIVLSDSAAGLTASAGSLLDVSDNFIGSAGDVLSANDRLLAEAEKQLGTGISIDTEAVKEAKEYIGSSSAAFKDFRKVITDLISGSDILYRRFLDRDRDRWVSRFDEMKKDADSHSKIFRDEGFTATADKFDELSAVLEGISGELKALNKGMSKAERRKALEKITADTDKAAALSDEIMIMIRDDIDANLEEALEHSRNSLSQYRTAMNGANRDLTKLSSTMSDYGKSLDTLKSSIDRTTSTLRSLRDGADSVAGLLTNASGNELLQRLNRLTANDEAALAGYLADPVKMETRVIWPVETYGSAMAPFYTVLAQWVGALLTAVLIKVKVKKRDDLQNLRLTEWYFGRYGLYLMVGVAQGLIVSLGDLLYVRIQCLDPIRFVLISVINGIVFTMINYALVFALDNIGLGAGVIILVLQVAGSGGTYPVEVLPEPFKVIYPLMPFRYSMDAMRECICGMYEDTYLKCVGTLMLFFVFAIAFGLALYHPARRLNEMIAESKAKSEIML